MVRLRNIMAGLAGFILLLVASVSCQWVFDPVDADGVDEKDDLTIVRLEMRLPVLSNTRTPVGDYDPGSEEWENFIDIHEGLRFYFFDGSNPSVQSPLYIGVLDPDDIRIECVETLGSRFKRYILRGVLKKEVADILSSGQDSGFRLVAMANCGSYPEPDDSGHLIMGGSVITCLSQLVECMTFTLDNPITTLDRDNLIPMFGIKECTDVDLVEGEFNDLGLLHMIRALSKVEVCVSEQECDDLAYVKLNNYNLSGLCAPKDVTRESDYVKDTYAEDYVGHLSLIDDRNELTTRIFSMQSPYMVAYPGGTERKVWRAYIPEYRNLNSSGTGSSEDRSYLTLKFDDSDDSREFRLDFKYYDTAAAAAANASVGDYFNVSRNNYYKYIVRRTSGYLDIEVDVKPYTIVDLLPVFGLDTNN